MKLCLTWAGLAGTTPAQVRQSFIGAGVILGGAIPIGDSLGALGLFGGGAEAAAAAAEDTGATAAEDEGDHIVLGKSIGLEERAAVARR
jgi:hypothetical protein